jgi:cell division protein ZapA
MSNQLKIKISIADRVYPLTIHPDQEEGLRKAAKDIETMIKRFEQSYAVRDKQDVLAMSALQFAAQVAQRDLNEIEDKQQIQTKLEFLNKKLQEFIS